MKKIKKFLLTMAMTMALGTSAFAASGFEFLFQLAGGINLGIPLKETKDLYSEIKGELGADIGVDAQIGYMFQVKDGFGISVLGELGYSFDGYSMGYGSGGAISSGSVGGGNTTYSAEASLSIQQFFHSFKLGLLPKFNIGFGGRHGLAVGIGGGVKIPLAGNMSTTSTIAVNGAASDAGIKTEDKITLSRQDINDFFSPSVIGYMKVTFDYYLFFTDNIAMNFGLYLGGDFGMKPTGVDAFDIGLQLGFRFGPKA